MQRITPGTGLPGAFRRSVKKVPNASFQGVDPGEMIFLDFPFRVKESRKCVGWLGGVFGHSSINKFFHKTGRKGFFGWKPNRAFSEIISSQLLAVCSNRVSTDVEGAVPLRSTEGNEQLRVK